MDESSFVKRSDKNTTRNCIYIKSFPVKLSLIDENDSNHASIGAAVTLKGQTHLLISRTEKTPSEVINSPLGNHFHCFKPKRGYLTGDVMLYWINNIYLPYTKYTKQLIANKDAIPLLILDCLKAHHVFKVNQLLQNNRIEALTLPPHSSHLFQCLGLCFFGVMKKHFKLC